MTSGRQLILGLFFLAAFSILAAYTLFLSDISWFGDDQELVVEFPEAKNLRIGDAVLVAGMRVGRVTDMTFDPDAAPDRRIAVVLTIQEGIVLREDYAIVIEETTLLGGRNVNIDTGDPALDAVDLASARRLSGSIEPNPLEALNQVNDLIAENRGSVRSIIEDFEALVAGAREGRGTVGRLLTDEALADRLWESVDGFATAVEGANEVVADVRAGRGTLGRLLKEEELYGTIESIAEGFRAAADDLRVISADLEAGQGTAGALLRDPELEARVRNAIDSVDRIATRLDAGEGTFGRLLVDDTLARDLERIVGDVADGKGTLGALIASDEMYETVRSAFDDVGAVAAQIRSGEGTVGKLIMEQDLYDEALDSVQLLTRSLEDYREAAPVSTFTQVLFGAF